MKFLGSGDIEVIDYKGNIMWSLSKYLATEFRRKNNGWNFWPFVRYPQIQIDLKHARVCACICIRM